MTRQPEWRLLHPLGDTGNIYRDATGAYEPEVECWEEYEDRERETRWLVYRYTLERKSFFRGNVIPRGFHRRTDLPHPIGRYTEWYSRDLDAVARSAGTTKIELVRGLCSSDVLRRYHAYASIAGHHGLDNFDSYPLDLSEEEMDEREARDKKAS